MDSQEEKIFQAYLKKSPIAHALPRTLECLVLQRFKLNPPILDLGCGDGVFAKICLGKGKIEAGLDRDPRVAKLAQKSEAYQKVVVTSADNLPFQDDFFNTVIANSVLEHIENLNPVFKETHRVLKKGGRFIFLVPDKTASDYFFYARVLEKIKLKSLVNFYIKLKNKMYAYVHLANKDFWKKQAEKNGFRIKSITGLISPQAVKIIDLFTPSALPAYLLRKIWGRSFVLYPDFLARLIASCLLRYCCSVKKSQTTAWCFELEKA